MYSKITVVYWKYCIVHLKLAKRVNLTCSHHTHTTYEHTYTRRPHMNTHTTYEHTPIPHMNTHHT
jgi:hypothetical protein